MNRLQLVRSAAGPAIAGASVIAPHTEEMVCHGYTDGLTSGTLGVNFPGVFRDVRG